jgi:hypothetical protein
MKHSIFRMANLPPPPPGGASGKSRKTLYAIVLIAIIVVAVAVGAYAMMNKGSPNSNPTPAPSQTSSPSQTSTPASSTSASTTPAGTSTPQGSATPTPQTTSSPSGSETIVNFQVGKWANYTIKEFDTDGTTVTAESRMKESVSEGNIPQGQFAGQNSWILTLATDEIAGGQITSTTSVLMYFSIGTMEALRSEIWMNGQLFMGFDYNDTNPVDPGTIPTEIDPSTIIGHETKTVAAGTFADCIKSQTTIEGTGSTSIMWAHQSVPIFGFVYIQETTNGVLSSTTELTDYSR